MRFAFTDDQLLFRDAVREFLTKECPPDAVRTAWDSGVAHAEDLWQALADLGVVGLTAPEHYGGLGLRELDLVLLLEEAGRAALPEPLLETTSVAVPLLADSGSDGAAPLIERIASGEAVVAVAVDDSLVLDADVATAVLHVTQDQVVLYSTTEIELDRQPSVDGARHLFRVWPTGEGTTIATAENAIRLRALALDRGALGASAQLIGLADRMLAMTVEYVQQREQFGVPIGSFQAIKHHLADALLAVEFAKPVVHNAAYSMTHDLETASRDVSMAKAAASDAATLVVREALQCHGAIAYTVEYDLHMWMKRVWALAAAWGDARFHRARVAESVLGAVPAD
jgi:alkylation response protein AidB-like acyl-CoA dehydrogenase